MRRLFPSFLVIIFIFSIVISGTALPLSANGALALPVDAKFSIHYKEGYKLLTVLAPWPGSAKTYTYALYPRNSAPPKGVRADAMIPVPVNRVVTFSTTYLPVLESVGALSALKGVDSIDYVYNKQVQKLSAEGKVVQTTRNWMPDIERLISIKPEAVFTYGVGNEWDTYPKMEEAGLPVVIIGEWNEADPLARAAWAIFIAAFFDKEALALEQFQAMSDEYQRLKKAAQNVKSKPIVLTNGPFSGTWNVPSGGSYMATLLSDAGAMHPWADSKGTGSISLSVEAVFEKALNAKIWLNPGAQAGSLADVKNMDPRFSAIPALMAGEVWNNTRRVSPAGGNDYYESAVMQPHIVLADLIAIAHPELLPGHKFYYYTKLGQP